MRPSSTSSASSPAIWKATASIAATAGLAAAATMLIVQPGQGDYVAGGASTNPDDAGPAITALIHGHISQLPDVQPLMGLTSLLVRAPFAALGDALGGPLLSYRLGAFACLWALAALVVAAAWTLRGASALTRVALVGLVLLNPATTGALTAGHPEELLLAATAVGGVWAGARGARTAAGVLTGVAIGTKPFGVVAVPALAASHARSAKAILLAIGVGAVLTLPLPIASPHTYLDGSRHLARHERIFAPSVWWPFGHDRRQLFSTGAGPESQILRIMPGGLDRGTGIALALVGGLLAGCLVAWRSRGRLGVDALALLAALFFARSFFDPENLEYYAAPAFAALAVWEAARGRPPLLTAVAVAADAITFHAGLGRSDLQATAFLVWILPLTAVLLFAAVSRSRPAPARA